jgi:hypothetical protein
MTAPLPLMTRADIDNGLYHGNLDANGSSNGNGSASFGGGASGNAGGGGDSGSGSNGGSGGGAAQFAETSRSLEAPAAPPTAAANTQQPAPPDLDALAHQVYSILKRRLSAERRRLID